MITIAKLHPGLVGVARFPGVFPQVMLLAALGAGAGIGPAAMAAGLCYAAVVAGFLNGSLRARHSGPLDPADHLTLIRSVLVGGVTALVVEHLHAPVPEAALVGMAAVALILAAVDGRRRATLVGGRLGAEIDAFLVLVLSAYVATLLGPWVLVAGAWRYAVVAVAWASPRLRGPFRYGRTVATLQGVLLLVAGISA